MGIGAEQAEEERREGRNCRMAMQISIAKKPNRGKSKAASKAMQGRAQRVAPQALTTLSKRHRRRRRHRRGVLLLLLGKH